MLLSNKIKTMLMCYFRFKRGFTVATEVPYTYGMADFMFVDKSNKITEIEIKISQSDLGHEFVKHNETKSNKHWSMKENPNNNKLPNFYYICVPTKLIDKATALIVHSNIKIGLIEFISSIEEKGYNKYFKIVRKAKCLHTNKDEKMKWLVTQRCCSELCNLRLKELKSNLKEES
jgi:hypothetical protein